MSVHNFLIVILLLCVYLATGQNVTNFTAATCKPTEELCIQKCLRSGYVFKRDGQTWKQVKYNGETGKIIYKVYQSNQTHIETDNFIANISITPVQETKKWIFLDMDEVLGITLYNSSAILSLKDFVWLIPPRQYCVEHVLVGAELNNSLRFALLESDHLKLDNGTRIKEAALYFPFLLLSCISFFISAIFYICVLDIDQRNNKKCFVGYTLAMGFSFLSLILLQKINHACQYIGAFFLFFTISGFVWFLFLCLDLVLDIIYFEQGYETKTLWIIYLSTSTVIPIFVIIASLGNGNFGIPQTFIKSYVSDVTLCTYEDSNYATFFAPVSAVLLFSFICICLVVVNFKKNNREHNNKFQWSGKRDKYKYMCISCTLIWITLTVWIVETGINSVVQSSFRTIALDLIEALEGIFAIVIFVSDRYTRNALQKKIQRTFRKNKDNILELNDIGLQTNNESNNLMCSNDQPITD